MKFKHRLSKLNQEGILHILPVIIIILLVAIAGTFYLVSSKAEQAGSTRPSNTFLVYSAGGKYRSVTISTYTEDNARCGKSDINDKQSAIYKFKKKNGKWQPIVIKCYFLSNSAATKNRTLYQFRFNKDAKHPDSARTDSEVSKSNADNCVFVHDYGITKVVSRINGDKSPCKSQSDEDIVIKSDSVISINSYTIKNYQVESNLDFGVKPKNMPSGTEYESASKQECQGYISERFLSNGKEVARPWTTRLKYDTQSNTCNYTGGSKAKIEMFRGMTPKDYKVTVEVKFSGNKYVNGYTHDLFVRDIR